MGVSVGEHRLNSQTLLNCTCSGSLACALVMKGDPGARVGAGKGECCRGAFMSLHRTVYTALKLMFY